MNLLFMANNGLPRNGLVALYDPYRDTYGRNILPVGSENFVTGWGTSDGAIRTITQNQVVAEWNTGSATRLTITAGNGTSTVKYYSSAGVSTIGVIYFAKIYVKNIGTNTVTVANNLGSSTLVLAGETREVKLSTIGNGSSATQIQFRSDVATNGFDVVVYQPQINIGTPYPYSPPAGLPQSLTDYSQHGNSAQNGSTASADTNDALWSGVALVHTTNHYQLTNTISALDMSNFSMLVVGKFAGTSGAITSLAVPSVTNKYQGVKYVSSGNLAIISCNAGTESVSGNLVVSTTDNVTLLFTASGGILTLKNLATGASVTLTDTAPTGVPRIGMGCVAGLTIAQIASALTWYNVAPYSRVLTTAEVARAYADLKRRNNVKGVVVA